MTEKDITVIVNKYRAAKEEGRSPYFDADEFCDLADYFDSTGELDEAREIIDEGLSIHPQNVPLLVKKAKLSVYDGEYEEALLLLRSVTEYDYDLYLLRIECFLQTSQYQQAYNLSQELLEKEDQEPLENSLAELGFLHVEADCYKEGIAFLEESLKYNSENVDALSDLAYAYEMAGDFEKAIETTNKILDIEPYTYEAWINLGKLHTLREEYENAIDAFDFALTINDGDHIVLKLKAHCMSLVGRTEEAIDIFKELICETPDDSTIFFLLAECYQTLEMYDEALDYLESYRKLEGETEDLMAKEAYLYMRKGDLRKAASMAEGGLLVNPYSLDFNIIAGEIAFQEENYLKAEEYLINAYRENENNFRLIDLLAIINIKKEDYAEAARYTEELLQLDSKNLEVKQRLALLYFEIDDKDRFNGVLDQFTDDELFSLFELIYIPESRDFFDRDMLISYLNRGRETRTLFKNIKY